MSVKKNPDWNIFFFSTAEGRYRKTLLIDCSVDDCFDRENVNMPSNIHTFNIISKVLPFASLLGFPSELSL